MSQTIANLSAVLKNAYLPAFENQLTTDPSPFMEKIRKVPLAAATVVASASVGFNGGFSYGADDGGDAPKAGAQRYAGFQLPSKNMYVNIEISDKVVKLGSSNTSAMLNAFDREIKGAYEAANFHVGRALFGDGSGVLATCTSTAGVFNDVSKLREGVLIDVYNSTKEIKAEGLRIAGVDRKNKKIAVTGGTVTWAEGDFITVQMSYNNEICGIGAVMDDNVTELYGVEKASNEWIKPTVIDCSGIELSDVILYEGVSEAKTYKSTKVDMLLCGDEAFKAYQIYMRTHNTVLVDKTMKFKGGAVGYVLNVGSQEVVLVNEPFVPTGEIWGVCSSDWAFHHTPLGFATVDDSSTFERIPGTTRFGALLAMYGNLICENPGGCVKFINCIA